jgi:hypothetical protein
LAGLPCPAIDSDAHMLVIDVVDEDVKATFSQAKRN